MTFKSGGAIEIGQQLVKLATNRKYTCKCCLDFKKQSWRGCFEFMNRVRADSGILPKSF